MKNIPNRNSIADRFMKVFPVRREHGSTWTLRCFLLEGRRHGMEHSQQQSRPVTPNLSAATTA
jgi:hypothetical protein